MNLHLTHDDKVLDYFIEMASQLGMSEDKYIVYTPLPELKYTKSNEVLFSPFDSDLFWQQVGDIQQYDKIFLHYLSHELVAFVNKITTSAKIIWVFWGADAFDALPFFKTYFFQPKTKEIYLKQAHLQSFTNVNPLKTARSLRAFFAEKYRLRQRLKAFARIDYFAHYIPQDFALIKTHYPQLKADFLPFHYAAIETVADREIDIQGVHILLGNSADFTGNHVDAMLKMEKWKLGNRKIIVPLAYGNPIHRNIVIETGQKLFGETFQSLTDFLSLEKYNEMLASIGIAIMPQERSQAAGNLMVLLWNGAKVYMAEKSTLFQLFKTYKMHVYAIEGNDFVEKEVFLPLSPIQKTENRQALLRLWGRENYVELFKNVLSLSRR